MKLQLFSVSFRAVLAVLAAGVLTSALTGCGGAATGSSCCTTTGYQGLGFAGKALVGQTAFDWSFGRPVCDGRQRQRLKRRRASPQCIDHGQFGSVFCNGGLRLPLGRFPALPGGARRTAGVGGCRGQ